MFLQYKKNKYGTKVAEFECDSCESIFTVCPCPDISRINNYPGCQHEDCSTYNPDTDVDYLFSSKDEISKNKIVNLKHWKDKKEIKIIKTKI